MPRLSRTVAEIDPKLRQVLRALVSGEAPWPLLLYGPAGCGKTCAALCLLDHTVGLGLYYTVPALCQLLIQAQMGRLEWSKEGRGGTIWPEKIWTNIHDAVLVVLDELGCREKVSDHHYEVVKQCIDERLGKPLVVISNLEPKVLARVYDDRIFSRLAAGTIFFLGGPDRRIAP